MNHDIMTIIIHAMARYTLPRFAARTHEIKQLPDCAKQVADIIQYTFCPWTWIYYTCGRCHMNGSGKHEDRYCRYVEGSDLESHEWMTDTLLIDLFAVSWIQTMTMQQIRQ
jgi:hypothetical protein